MLRDKQTLLGFCNKLSEWSIYLLIFCLPFSKTIIEICISVALVCFVIKKIITKERLFTKSQLNIAFLIFILSLLPSFINTYNILFSLRALISKNIKFVLLAIIMLDIIDNRTKLKNLLTMALLSGLITIINASIQYFITHIDLLHNYVSFKYREFYQHEPFIGFPTASFPYPNDFAAWLLVFLLPVMAIIFMWNRRARNRIFYTLYFIPLFYFFILTKARGAWLGFFTGVAFLFFFRLKKIVLILLVLSFVAYLGINRNIARYVIQFTSIDDRITMWDNGWKIFKEHPVVGNGINTFFEKYKRIRNDRFKNERGSYAHNCFLQMAADTGIIGLMGFLYLLFVFFKSSVRRAIKLKDEFYKVFVLGLLAGILAFLVHSFFDTNLYSLPLAALFWFALGLSGAILRIEEAKVV